MRVREEDPTAVVRAVFHEIRSRIGAVRLAITTLEQGAPDPDVVAGLLRTADRETVRLSTDMVGAGALVQCVLDRSPRSAVDVGRAMRRAASRARARGVAARSRGGRGLHVRARTPSLEAALAALMQLVADGDGEAVTSASRDGRKVQVRIAPVAGATDSPDSLLARSLIEAAGGTLVHSERGLVLHLPGARP